VKAVLKEVLTTPLRVHLVRLLLVGLATSATAPTTTDGLLQVLLLVVVLLLLPGARRRRLARTRQ
jgi:hypothetical protein